MYYLCIESQKGFGPCIRERLIDWLNPGLWSGAPHSPCYCCLHSNHAQWVQQWWPRPSFQVLSFCVEFPRFIGIYWLLSVTISCSFLTIAWDRTVSYHIVISLSESWYVLSRVGASTQILSTSTSTSTLLSMSTSMSTSTEKNVRVWVRVRVL